MQEALEALDFDAVRRAVAARAQTSLGEEAALALAPVDQATAVARQRRSAEAKFFPLRLGGVRDLRPMLEALQKGARLEGPDLLAAAQTLERAMALRAALDETELEALKDAAAAIGDHTAFTRAVARALDETGAVKDEASAKLKALRRRIAPLRRRIQARIYELMERHQEALSDRFVTVRRGRYVLPVKAERVHEVPGIVLDRSSSGATFFVEPAGVVPLNNELAELLLEEEAEVRRILAELSARLAQDAGVPASLEALATLDLAEAGRRLAEDWGLTDPTFGPAGSLALEAAFHPLIPDPVKNDLRLDTQTRILLISGPNMGGKTAILKTLGLAALMAQAGLFVPARRAILPYFERIFVDIGDRQDLMASLSTFAAHLLRLKEAVEGADAASLVLLDELGTGTDPEEGAALAQAVLEALLERRALGVATTHLTPLKVFASETPGVENASMQFDPETLAPTYRLLVGVPGRSYALAIAERLGFPPALLERARALAGAKGQRLEALLAEMEQEKARLDEALAAAEAARQAAEEKEEALKARLEELERRREEALAEARAEAAQLLKEAERQIKRLKARAKTTEGKKDALKEVIALRQKVQPQPRANPYPDLKPGTLVEVPDYRQKGRVLRVKDGLAQVQIGLLKVEVPVNRLKPRDEGAPRPKEAVVVKSGFEPELNLRGLTQAEALLALDEFLAEAHALKETPIRILHGKGTGALRNAVRQALKRDKRVKSFHDAMPYEGGHGVTVVHLKV